MSAAMAPHEVDALLEDVRKGARSARRGVIMALVMSSLLVTVGVIQLTHMHHLPIAFGIAWTVIAALILGSTLIAARSTTPRALRTVLDALRDSPGAITGIRNTTPRRQRSYRGGWVEIRTDGAMIRIFTMSPTGLIHTLERRCGHHASAGAR